MGLLKKSDWQSWIWPIH